MIKVLIPIQLRDYTHNATQVEARGNSVAEVLNDLDRQFPGIRFRIIDEQDQVRPHVRIFINEDQARNINKSISPTDKLIILGALSGG